MFGITIPIAEWSYLLAVFCAVIGGVFWLSEKPLLRRFFHYLPPIIWCYFVPMILTAIGILPARHDFYGTLSNLVLPPTLILLLLSANIPSILRLGPKAIIIMLSGTLGIVLGAPIALLLFQRWLPPDAWRGLGALSGSWIGGSANMSALKESFQTPDSLFGVMVVVDTVVGYGWMAIVIFLAGYQDAFNRWNKADDSIIRDLNERLKSLAEERSRPLKQLDLNLMFAVAFGVGILTLPLGEIASKYIKIVWTSTGSAIARAIEAFPLEAWKDTAEVLSPFTCTIVLVTALGLLLSFTRFSRLEEAGASRLGYFGLYLIICTFGARADLHEISRYPLFLLVGIVWMAVHALCILIALRLLRAPLFFLAAGSQSNIGGPASAAIVCAVYQPALASVGVLLGVLGTIIGTYAGLLTGILCRLLAQLLL